jgi:hypothetical protein
MVCFPKNFALVNVISVGLDPAARPRRTGVKRVDAAVTPAKARPVRLRKSRRRMPEFSFPVAVSL